MHFRKLNNKDLIEIKNRIKKVYQLERERNFFGREISADQLSFI